jgi:hypothetical protein
LFLLICKTEPDGYGKYKIIADSIFLANQEVAAFSFQTVYNNPDMEQARVAVIIGIHCSTKL